MPIKPENKALYPSNWREIRARILERAQNRCEWCGVRNHSLGYRDEAGRFHPAEGKREDWINCAGKGLLAYRDAARGAKQYNVIGGIGPNGERAIVIVLTIAHLDHKLWNHDESNLRALCQACHLRYDAKQHVESARLTRLNKADAARPMLAGIGVSYSGDDD